MITDKLNTDYLVTENWSQKCSKITSKSLCEICTGEKSMPSSTSQDWPLAWHAVS
jgi:hypothetical protein